MNAITRPAEKLIATLPMTRQPRVRSRMDWPVLLALALHVAILLSLLFVAFTGEFALKGSPGEVEMVFEPAARPSIAGLETAPRPGTLPSPNQPPDARAQAPGATGDGLPTMTPGARVPVTPESRPSPKTPSLATAPGAPEAATEPENSHLPTPPPPGPPAEHGERQAVLVPLRPPSPRPSTPHREEPPSPFGGSLYVPNMTLGNGPTSHTAQAASRPAPSVDRPVGYSSRRTSSGMLAPNAHAREADPGPDFYASLMRWWNEHSFYPGGAVEREQEGDVGISVVVDRYGHMSHIILESRSGSVYLDLAGQSTWYNATVAPVPARLGLDHLTIDINMHYYLVQE